MKLAKFLLMLTYFTYPYYIFPSGGFQPAIGLCAGVFLALAVTAPSKIRFNGITQILIIYTIYAVVVNTLWYFRTNDDDFITHMIITIVGTFIYVTLSNVFSYFTKADAFTFLLVIFATLATQTLLLSLGMVKDAGAGRAIIWFNNPNQLGYFCVISATLAVISGYYYKIQSIMIPLIIGMAIFLTAFTLSRAALGGCLLFIPIMLFFSSTLSIARKLAIILVLAIAGAYIVDLYVQSETYTRLERRMENSSENQNQTEVRHFNRVWEQPDHLVFGAGKGGYDRFPGRAQEIHNLFLSVLYSFGIIGFLFYMSFWYKIIPNLQVLIYMFPVLTYNMTHNGGRALAFWFLLALIATGAANLAISKNAQRTLGKQSKTVSAGP